MNRREGAQADDGYPAGAARPWLRLLSRPYGWGAALKNILYDRGLRVPRKLPVPVLCVGNLSVGGTGKTPFVQYLAGHMAAQGLRPVLVSRGYRGRRGKEPLVVSDGRRVWAPPEQAGDEPVLLARKTGLPVVVGADRFAAGVLAVRRFHPDVLLLDDGFQHRRLARDLDIVLLDARRALDRAETLPWGRLREPVSGLERAHILVLTRWREQPVCRENWSFLKKRFDKPLFCAVHKPHALWNRSGTTDPSTLSGRRILGFSGLAQNDLFQETLGDLGAHVVHFEGFRDHFRYTGKTAERLADRAARAGAECMVTTEKDWMNLENLVSEDFDPWILSVEIRLMDEEARFWQCVGGRI